MVMVRTRFGSVEAADAGAAAPMAGDEVSA
jgi:hypothetical protein